MFIEETFKDIDMITFEHYYQAGEDEESGWYHVRAREYSYEFNADQLDWGCVDYYGIPNDYDKATAHLKTTMKKWDSLIGARIQDFSMYNMDILSLK